MSKGACQDVVQCVPRLTCMHASKLCVLEKRMVLSLFWKSAALDDTDSAIALFQIFSEKPLISLFTAYF